MSENKCPSAEPKTVDYSSPQAFFKSVEKPIRKVLIANNGNAAVKGIRSLKSWSNMLFEKEIFHFVVMATKDDIEAKSEYIFEGHSVVEVPEGPSSLNFSNITLIVDLALKNRCDAVWPGWGHASENHRLAKALVRRGVQWIGPSSESMISLGDKIGSSIIAQSVDVPCVRWSGSTVFVEPELVTGRVNVTEDLLDKACVTSSEDALVHAERIGYPLMAKASEGGGGKGIRRVYSKEEVHDAYHAVTNEVKDSPVFLMGLVENCRHLEVQIIADSHGNSWAVNSRDCTLQRRCQKMIEEGPITAAPLHMVQKMEKSAERLILSVGYENAATVEYLFDPATNDYYFLEVNARLQVEHVVSEENSDVNLPAAQFLVAMGVPLTQIEDLNLWYNRVDQSVVALRHCIACRVTAEHAEEHFRPTAGEVSEICFTPGPHVWGYFSIGASGRIHSFADSQFGHIFAMGTTRTIAIRRMINALGHLTIRGEIHTNVDALLQLLRDEDFRNNKTTTTWIETKFNLNSVAPPSITNNETAEKFFVGYLAAVVYTISQKFEASVDTFKQALSTGHHPNNLLLEAPCELVYKAKDHKDTKIASHAYAIGANRIRVVIGKGSVDCDYKKFDGSGEMLLTVNGTSHKIFCLEAQGIRVQLPDNSVMSFFDDDDPGLVISEMSGRLLKWLIKDKDMAQAGDAFCEIEVMKMFMPLKLKFTGRIRHKISEGTTFKVGDLLATLCFDDVENATVSEPAQLYQGTFCSSLLSPSLSSLDTILAEDLTVLWEHLDEGMLHILSGYCCELDLTHSHVLKGYIKNFMNVLCHPRLLPSLALNALNSIERDLSRTDFNTIVAIINQEEDRVEVNLLAHQIDMLTFKQAPSEELDQLLVALRRLMDYRLWRIEPVKFYIEKFLDNQNNYRDFERGVPQDDADIVVNSFRSHAATAITVDCLSEMIGTLCTYYGSMNFETLHKAMGDLVDRVENEINSESCHNLVLACRHLRLSRSIPRLPERISTVHEAIKSSFENENIPKSLSDFTLPSINSDWLVNTTKLPDDAIVSTLTDGTLEPWMRRFSLWLYVRRHYESLGLNKIAEVTLPNDAGRLVACWMHSYPLDERYLESDAASNGVNTPKSAALSNKDKEKDRLKHMLRVFHSDMHSVNLDLQSHSHHQSIGCAFSGPRDFMRNAVTVLEGIHRVHFSGGLPAEHDPVSLVCMIGLNDASRQLEECPVEEKAQADDSFPEDFPITADWLFDAVKACKPVLQALSVHSIKIVYLSGTTQEPRDHGFLYWQPRSLNSRLRLLYFSAQKLAFLNHNPEENAVATNGDSLRYKEVEILRFCPLPFVPLLELSKLSNFDITPVPILQPSTFVFKAVPKKQGSKDVRLFCRTIFQFHHQDEDDANEASWAGELERAFLASMHTVETVLNGTQNPRSCSQGGNHLLMVLLTYGGCPNTSITAKQLQRIATKFYKENQTKAREINLRQIEVRVLQRGRRHVTLSVPIRLVLDDPTGQAIRCRIYAERVDPASGTALYHPITRCYINGIEERKGSDEYAHHPVNTAHPVLNELDEQRVLAMKFGTIYARDFLHVFEAAAHYLWEESVPDVSTPYPLTSQQQSADTSPRIGSQSGRHEIPDKLLEAIELVLNENDQLVELKQTNKPQKIGMLAWEVRIKTPEFPQCRSFILIANDITHQRGSFGVKEDVLFLRATEKAMFHGFPRIYIAANSGARIGIAKEIQNAYEIEWVDPAQPSKGFLYLYLTEEKYQQYSDIVQCNQIDHPTKGIIYVLDGIIGKDVGMGVENLAGSGAIAGITSKAYNEIVTYTYVTGLTVGIGAYLTRLGHRVVQKEAHAPILLTGYQALNKLIGKEVYRSNNEIGGPGVMHRNGVTCDTVKSDLQGCIQLLRLLSYVPAYRRGPMAISTTVSDPIDRDIQYKGDNSEDPRFMFAGKYITSPELLTGTAPKWLGGIFDKGTWLETNCNWARSVITGRARLGGIPIGAIAVESRSSESVVLADPAMPESTEMTLKRAGQVWYPDSAFKTAQAINDFNREELPLIIFANWRGFSGGQRDMYFEVLKFGSMIVDALVAYNQPVFVYLAPHCELRGGAWVVVDPRINELNMEMYADPNSRGGVMEAPGTVAIKYRDPAIRQTIKRLDEDYIQLLEEDEKLAAQGIQVDDFRRKALSEARDKRFKELLPSYQKAATNFCDLHDKVVRMETHGVIDGQVDWSDARDFFYWRLRRQLVINELRNEVETILVQRIHQGKSLPEIEDTEGHHTVTVDLFQQESLTRMANVLIEEWLKCNGLDTQKNIVSVACQAATLDWESYIDRRSDSTNHVVPLLRPSPSSNTVPTSALTPAAEDKLTTQMIETPLLHIHHLQ